MSDMFEQLAAPFPPEAVSWRVGSSNKKKRQRETGDQNAKATKGMALAYIDARDVMDRLDAVCGPGGWSCRYPHAAAKTVCDIGVKVDGEWVWKADGAGDTDHEAQKGAMSDSFKRAAVRWGIGRYLYHLPSPWVDLDEREQIDGPSMAKLRALLTTNASPPKAAQPPSIHERADKLIAAINNADGGVALGKVWGNGAKLCAELSTADPDKLAAITKLYETRRDELTGATPFDTEQKAA